MNDRPNILLVMTDEQCGHAMSCAGNPYVNTPAMDSLAEKGILFSQAYVTQPLCVPCRTAMQMGCWPHQTGVMTNAQKTVADDAPMYPMLGRLVADAGYRCGLIGKMHIAWRDSDGRRSITLGQDQFDLHGYDPVYECDDAEIPKAAKAFFEQDDSRPFFLTAAFLNPHDCIGIAHSLDSQESNIGPMPQKLDDLPPLPENFAIPENEPDVIRRHWERYSVPFNGGDYTPYPTKDWDELRWRQYLWGYYRLIERVDSQIGELLDHLESSGQADNTVIIFTADHGDGAGHHGWNQKQILYDEIVRVPLIIVGPRFANPGTIDTTHLMSGIDITPTILEYSGAERPAHVQGRSARPLLETGNWQAHDYVVSETLLGTGIDILGWAGRMVRTPEFKYVVYNHGSIREQLTDMANDPGEMVNLAVNPQYDSILAHHREILTEWCSQTGDLFLEEKNENIRLHHN